MNVLNLKRLCKCGNTMTVSKIEPVCEKDKVVDTMLIFQCSVCLNEKYESQSELEKTP